MIIMSSTIAPSRMREILAALQSINLDDLHDDDVSSVVSDGGTLCNTILLDLVEVIRKEDDPTMKQLQQCQAILMRKEVEIAELKEAVVRAEDLVVTLRSEIKALGVSLHSARADQKTRGVRMYAIGSSELPKQNYTCVGLDIERRYISNMYRPNDSSDATNYYLYTDDQDAVAIRESYRQDITSNGPNTYKYRTSVFSCCKLLSSEEMKAVLSLKPMEMRGSGAQHQMSVMDVGKANFQALIDQEMGKTGKPR